MKRLFLILCALALTAPAVYADVPVPDNCSCTLDATGRLYLCPHEDQPEGAGACESAWFTVIVRNEAGNVIPGAITEVLVGCQSERRVRLCELNNLVKTASATCEVEFNIGGGGCCKGPPGSAYAIIRANGVPIRSYDVINSADYSDIDNVGVPDRSDLDVDPVDLGAFVAVYAGGAGGASCHDYNNDGVTNPIDLGTFVEAYKGGANFCSPGPNAPPF
jgi:hypothetical protein